MPGVPVLSVPLVPLPLLLSAQNAIPGPFAASVHEKLVGTLCPTLYVWLLAGLAIAAVGGPTTV